MQDQEEKVAHDQNHLIPMGSAFIFDEAGYADIPHERLWQDECGNSKVREFGQTQALQTLRRSS